MNSKRNFKRELIKVFKKADLFGKPLSLKHKKNDTFTTVLGGMMSVLISIGIAAYLINLLN